jgi:hypothetical protein
MVTGIECNACGRPSHGLVTAMSDPSRFVTAETRHSITMGLVETGWGGVHWIGLPQDRYKWRALVNAVMNLLRP